ncbi:MAG: choice-of-anchor D domain-containing protein [Terracidiphilus sp.]
MKLAIAACLLALSVPCWATGPTSQYIFGSQAGEAVPTSGQSWTGLMPRNDVNVWAASAATGTSYTLMPTTGSFSSLCVNLSTAPGNGASWTWTLYKDGFDTAISVTISGAQTQVCDSIDTAGFVTGDLVALHLTPSAGPAPAATFASWYIVQTPQVPGETILIASQQVANGQFLSLSGNSSSSGTELGMGTVIPAAGTVTKFIAEYLGAGSSVREVLDQNQAPSTVLASLGASGTFVEQAANLSVSAGDLLDINETGITGTSAVYASIVFVPNVAGQFVLPTWRNSIYTGVPVFYLPITGRSDDYLQTIEGQAQQVGGNIAIQGMYVWSTAAPGSGGQYAFTLRDNGANTVLNATLSGTSLKVCTTSVSAAGCGTSSAIAVNSMDLLDTSVTLTGSPAGLSAGVSYLAYMPQLAFTTQPPATGAAGTALSPVVVQLQDNNGNPISGSTARVTISSSPAGVGGTLTVNAVNGVATFNNLVFDTAGSYTLTAIAGGLTAVTSSPVSIGAGPANGLVFTTEPPASGPAGTPLGAVVEVVDAFGNLATGSSAQVTIGSTPVGVSGTLTVTAVNGVATFSNLVFNSTGIYTLSAGAPGLAGATSSSISVGGGTANKLAFTTGPPSSGMVGTPLSSVVVQVEDVNGNLVNGSSAQVTISSTPAGVGGTLTVNAVSGVATFSNLVFGTTGSYTLSAASTGLAGVTSGSISITATRPTSQFFFGTQADIAVPTVGQSWTGILPRSDANVWAASATTGTSYALMPTTGTLSTFCLNLGTAPGAGASWTWTLYKNGSDQAISVKISGAQKQACDLVDTTGFAPGDLIALHVTPSVGPAPASTFASWYMVQTPQVAGETILFGSQQAGNAQFLALAGNSDSSGAETALATVMPTAGTITKYIAEYVGTGSSVKEVLNQNGSPSSFSASLGTSGVFVQQTGNLSVSAGDIFDVNETGLTALSGVYASAVFVPSVAGQFVIPTWRGTVTNADPVFYFPLTGRANGSLQPVEADAQQIGGVVQIQGVYVRSAGVPGSGAQYTFTLRDNGANTAMKTTLSGTNLTACTTSASVAGCSSGSAIAVNNLDLLDTSVVPTGSPVNTGGVVVSYLAYVPQLAFTTVPATGAAGTALSPVVVQLQDQNGNPISGSTAQVTIGSSPAGVGGTLTVNAVNGVATFSNLVFSASGSYTLSAAVSGLPAVSSSSISIGAAASKVVFSTEPPASGTAGSPLGSVVVQVEDVNGNLVTGSSAQVTISSTPTGVGGTLTVTAVNGVATFSNLVFTASGSYTLAAASPGLASATSSSISITAGPASKLAFTTGPPVSGTPGTPLGPVVVQVEDANGNLVTGSSALVTISSTPAGVSGTLTVTAANGVASFSNLVFNSSGSYTLTAASPGLAGVTSGTISIGAGTASKLAFTTGPPASGTAGSTLGSVVVQVEDINGNLVTGSSAQVMIGSTPGGVGGTLTVTAVNGVATFSNLVFTASGIYTLSAGSPGLTSATSSSISILPGAANKLVLASAPSTGTAGTALSSVVVQVEDLYGNLVTASSAQVTISSTPAGVSGTLTATAAGGVATFSNLVFTTSGSYTLSAASPGLAGVTSGSISIGAGAANKLALASAPSTGTIGTPLSPVIVQVEDINGNLVTGSSAQVTISSTPAGVSGTLTANAASGVATFSNLVFNSTGTYTLSAAATGLAGVTSGSISIFGSRPTSQYIFGTQAGSAAPTNTASFMGLSPRDEAGLWSADPSSSASYALMPTTGTLSSLCVNLTTAPGIGASWTWKLYKNGADQSLAVTISGAQTEACDSVDTTGFVPGDLVALHVTPSASPAPASTLSSWYVVQTPQIPGETVMFGSHPVAGNYILALGGNGSGFSVEKAMATIVPAAGTITKYIAEYVGTGSSVTAVLDQNESPTALSVSLTSGVPVQQAASLAVSPGDVFDVSEAGITASSPIYASMVFVPTVPGQFVIASYRNGEVNNSATTYFGLSGRSPDNFQPIESRAQQIGGNMQIQGIFVRTTVAPGSGTQWAYTLRDNGASTSLNTATTGTNLTSCTTSTAVAGCASGSPVTVNGLDLLDTQVVPTGSPALAETFDGVAVSYLAYLPQLAFITQPPATGTAGTALSPVVVQVQDANGNPLAGSTAQVTIGSSPAGVGGTLTVNAVNGVATFSNLVFTSTGSYTLSALASGLTPVTSSAISIGAGAAPVASLTASLAFPNTLAGTTSAAMAATLSNTGTAPLNNIVASITGTNPSDFALTTGANACGATLAAGSSCSIYVTFTPASATAFSATLSVADSATGSPQTASLTGTGIAPVASLSPSLSFPNTLTGTTSGAMAGTLSNTGTAPLNNIVASITGTNPSDFALTTGANACGATLAAGSSCSIYVTFTPATATSFAATLSVADSASGSPQTSSLTGTGIAPVASLTPSLPFPNTATGTTSAAIAATLSNTGTAPLNSIVASITGANPSDFALTTGANACGATLGAGSSCSIYVTFTPASATAFSATLSVGDSATGSPQTSSLTGTGIAPVASLTPSLPFPNTATGTTSAAIAATLSNTGTAPLNSIVASITGANPSDFALTTGANACGATLAAGSSCSIYVTFTPASATSFAATLSVADSAAGSPQTSNLTGTGITAIVSLTPALPFPNTLVSTTSAAIAATLSNTGGAPLNNVVASITGANPGDFALTTGANACGATLAAGSSCSIYVTFTPASAASFSATLSVADSASGSPQTSSLTGTGIAPIASLTPSVPFPNTVTGTTSAALSATLSNTGTAPLNNIVASITGTNPSDFALTTGANACGATLAAGSSCSIYVTFTPASAVSFSATLSVADSASGSPQTSNLTGTGIAPIASLTPSLGFSNTFTGTTSAALAATLSNTGTAPLNNIVPSITGANPSDFALTTGANACGATLAAGSSCSIYVTFTPASAASFAATLSVGDSATGSPQTASLTGTGIPPATMPWPNGYNYQATFTVAAGQVPSAQTNFPALISGTFADLATVANGGRISNTCTQAVGNNSTAVPCDLIFTSDAAGTQLLSWEFESWTPATGAVNIWVNVPTLANGTVIYAWYGQSGVYDPADHALIHMDELHGCVPLEGKPRRPRAAIERLNRERQQCHHGGPRGGQPAAARRDWRQHQLGRQHMGQSVQFVHVQLRANRLVLDCRLVQDSGERPGNDDLEVPAARQCRLGAGSVYGLLVSADCIWLVWNQHRHRRAGRNTSNKHGSVALRGGHLFGHRDCCWNDHLRRWR